MIFFLAILIPFYSMAETAIPFKDVFLKFPKSSKSAAKKAFSKDALPYWGVIAASTGVLYYYDEKISSGVRNQAEHWHVNRHYQTNHGYPRDIGSMLYFSGDGFIHLATGAAFVGIGKSTGNNYTANTGMMIFHGLTMTAVYSQLIKRTVGRESPVEKTQPRGAWHPFPSFKHYQTNTAKYDAMPSGHLMTATLTFTVLASRYEEYAVPIIGLGTIWIGALGFQMINNGVHWSSDYPLALGMGILIGRTVVHMGEEESPEKKNSVSSWHYYPGMAWGTPTVNAYKEF